jgi:hypothetical protein
MINNLKFYLVIILLLIMTCIHGQIRSGRFIGVNLTSMEIIYRDKTIDPDNSSGIHFGGLLDIPVAGNFTFRPGFMFSGKGSSYKIDSSEIFISPVYIEVPLMAAYTFGTRRIKLSLFTGPYFSFGFGGNKIENGGNTKNISYGSDAEDDIRHIDAGLNVGAGISYKDLMISVQYGLGMADISPVSIADREMKNKVIGISVTSFFIDKK